MSEANLKPDNISIEKKQQLLALLAKNNQARQQGASLFSIPIIPRKEGINTFPVSSFQMRFWYMQQMKPDSYEYNTPIAFQLKGELPVSLLQSAVDKMIQRHEIWRTIFMEEEGEPYQVVLPELIVPIEIMDLSGMHPDSMEHELLLRSQAARQKVFQLDKGPLVRFYLLKKSDMEHIFLIVVHHIINDAQSLNILQNEISKIYESLCTGTTLALPAPVIQYGDFSAWQNKENDPAILNRQLVFWKEKLQGRIEHLELHTDYKRREIRREIGDHYYFRLTSELSDALKKIMTSRKQTMFMILLAALQTLLYRQTGQDYITIGSPISDRPFEETQMLLGVFINTLVFNTCFDENKTFSEILDQVSQDAIDAYDNKDIPFDEVVRALHLKRDLSRTPVYQVLFNYISAPETEFSLYNLDTEEYNLGSVKASTDICIYSCYNGNFVSFDIEYSSDLFKKSTIKRLGEQFSILLENICKNMDVPISKLEILSPEEKEKLVKGTYSQIQIPDCSSIHNIIEAQTEKTPDAVAVTFEGNKLTFNELNKKANQMAHHLIRQGVGKETKIALFIDRSLEMIIAMLAVLKAGAAYIPLDPIYPPERVRAILHSGEITLVIAQRALIPSLSQLEGLDIITLNSSSLKNFSSYPEENPDIVIDPHSLMYMVFTSGSTGDPKGVMVEHSNFIRYLFAFKSRLEIKEPVSFAIVSTFAADLGTPNVYLPLTTGGTLHIVSYERATSPEKFAEYFSIHNIDGLKLVPSHFEALMAIDNPKEILPGKFLIFAGETCHREFIEKVRKLNPECTIYNCYGPTEITVSSHCYKIPDEIPEENQQSIPLGHPLAGINAYLLDQHMTPVPIGVKGELYIGGATVSRGYFGNETLTQERFLQSPFHENERVYKTGDICRITEDGCFEFISRADRQVKIRGYRVELGEIERVIRTYQEVEDTIAAIKKDDNDNERLVSYLIAKNKEEKINTKDLRKFIGIALPDYMVPSLFVTLEAFPITPNGKIDMKALPEPSLDLSSIGENYTAPRNETEQELAGIWSEVLGISKIGIDDDFFDLGGESLKAIKITRKMGYKLNILQLFQHPTIRELAEALSGKSTNDDGYLVKLTPDQPNKSLNLICFPFAATYPIAYQPLANELPKNYDLYAIKLPGHDFANKEEALVSFEEMAKHIIDEIKTKISGPIAIYAQCVGGGLALRTAFLAEEAGLDLVCLFEAANFPMPHFKGKFFDVWSKIVPSDRWISDRVYLETLRTVGNSDEIANKEEEKFIVKSIRHDARGAEQFFSDVCYRKGLKKLSAPICCIYGERDRTTEFYQERFEEWGVFTEHLSIDVIEYAGHFFHKYQPKELSGIITAQQTACQMLRNNSTGDADIIETFFATKREKIKLGIFFMVIFSQIIFALGLNSSGYGMGAWMYQKTGSLTYYSITFICTLIPLLLLNPIAGTVADRYDKRKVMMFGNFLGFGGILFAAVMYLTGSVQPWHFYIATTITAIGTTFQWPTLLSAMPQLVPKRYLGQFNGFVNFTTAGGQVLGPILGGILLKSIGLQAIFMFNFVACFVCILSLMAIRFPNRMTRKLEEPFIKEFIGGWKYITSRRSLVSMVLFFVFFNFLLSIVTIFFQPLALAYNDEATAGAILSVEGIGLLVGGLVMSLWGGTKRRTVGMVGFCFFVGAGLIIMGLRPSNIFIISGLFLYSISMAFLNTHWQILIQTKVGLELQGRVFSINQVMVFCLRPLAMFLAAPICEEILHPFMEKSSTGVQIIRNVIGNGESNAIALLFIIIGLLVMLWTILGLRMKSLMLMEDILPNAIPGGIIHKDKDKLQEIQLRTSKANEAVS